MSGRAATARPLLVAVWTGVALLAVICLQLGTMDGVSSGGAQATGTTGLTPPSLPPSRGRSAEAVLRELDTTTGRFAKPLRNVEANLAAAVDQLSFTESLPETLDSIAQNTGGFGSIPGSLGELTRQTRGFHTLPSDLRRLAEESRHLGAVRTALATVVTEMRALRSAAGSLDEMARRVREMSGSFSRATEDIGAVRGAAAALPDIAQSMRAMAVDVEKIRRCTERPVVCGSGGR